MQDLGVGGQLVAVRRVRRLTRDPVGGKRSVISIAFDVYALVQNM